MKPKTITPDTAWIKTRLKERGVTLDDAAAKIGTYKLMLHRLLSGSRPARTEEILALGDVLGLPPIEALRRFGHTVADAQSDLIGRVNEHGRAVFFAPNECRKVVAPADSAADTRALVVDAPHSRLAIYDGALLYYVPAKAVDAQAVGRLAVVELGDQAAPVVGVLAYLSANKKRATLLGGVDTIESAQLISAAPVNWIRAF